MKFKNGFSMMELLLVIAIIGILTTLGVTSYRGAVVHSRVAQGRHGISLIAQAEKIIQIDTGSYNATATGFIDNNIGSGGSGIDLRQLDADTEWSYAVTIGGGGEIVAKRLVDPCKDDTITYDLTTGVWNLSDCLQ